MSATTTGVGAPAQHANHAIRWWILATVGLAQLMVVLDATIVNIALPAAQTDLGFSDGNRQWIVTAYSLAFGSLLLFGGRLSDVVGRKPMFLIGLIGFAGSSALGGAATSFGMLVGARALQGAFGAMLAPTALALLTTTFIDPKERAKAFGVFGAIAGGGGAVGLLLGGVLTEHLNWRWNLYVNVVFAVAALIGGILFVKNPARTGPRARIDVPGTILISAGLFSLVFGFSNAETNGWSDWTCWGFLAAAVVLLLAFGFWQQRAAHPLLPLLILKDRNRGAALLSVIIVGAGMFGVFLFLTYYLELTLRFTPIQTGLGFLPLILSLILSAQFSTNVFTRVLGPKVLATIGLILGALGMLYLSRLGVSANYAADVLPGLILVGLGVGSVMPPAIQGATVGLDPRYAGVASATVNTSQQVGGSIGTALLNTLAASAATAYVGSHTAASNTAAGIAAFKMNAAVYEYHVAFLYGALFFAIAAVVTAVLYRRKGVPGKTDATDIEETVGTHTQSTPVSA
ncbi:MFS transporter [Frondihabitans cladoniiphilus]|uniref:MFS transporter n=1 Tax=Frondihabitans cladoniiphilus TaxID=715785 RepID=A0ABP8W4A4_9MICO